MLTVQQVPFKIHRKQHMIRYLFFSSGYFGYFVRFKSSKITNNKFLGFEQLFLFYLS